MTAPARPASAPGAPPLQPPGSNGSRRQRLWSRLGGGPVVVTDLGPGPDGARRRWLWSRLGRGRVAAGTDPAPEAVALAADLLAMAAAAGLTPYLALEIVATFGPEPAAARLAAVLESVEGGVRLADALEAEAGRTPALAPVLVLLAASERSGAPVAAALTRLAAQVRGQVRRRATARARTVPVRLLFPLVFLVLPAFLLLTVAPVVLASLSH